MELGPDALRPGSLQFMANMMTYAFSKYVIDMSDLEYMYSCAAGKTLMLREPEEKRFRLFL